jgi:hypothetical protein
LSLRRWILQSLLAIWLLRDRRKTLPS